MPSKKDLINERMHQKPAAPAKNSPAAAPAARPVPTGKTSAFWLDDEDRHILREASIMALSQGLRPSDSLILRAALRLMPRDPRLIEQLQALIERDGRKRRHQRKAS